MEEEQEMQSNESGFGETRGTEYVNRRCGAAIVSFVCGRTGLLILVTGYAFFGAILFRTLESGSAPLSSDLDAVAGTSTAPVQQIQQSREDCLRELWLITERLNVLYEKNWTKLVTEQLKRFEKAVIESSGKDDFPHSSGAHWTFGGALLYTITLLTTVGYGRLSPRTATGKAVAMVYAVIGVPLMLILLSGLGSLLAVGARKGYSKLCCRRAETSTAAKFMPSVGYQRAPSSPSGKHVCRPPNDDAASIQIAPNPHAAVQNHVNHKQIHLKMEHHIVPKKVLLATVRTSHARGRCVQSQVRQMLTDTHFCPSHGLQPPRGFIGTMPGSDLQEVEEEDENEQSFSHNTPSRMPLIWQSSDRESSRAPSPNTSSNTTSSTPAVPVVLVILFLISYVCLGATIFTFTSGWSFLDAAYFCFIALSTIGIGDRLPQNSDYSTQLQLLACCLYLFIGLVIVAMCFSLVHDEVVTRCRQFAITMGLVRH
ncbi:uncharacterized protein LOC108734605 [Agrilus planipennis]|uniref:Uncharacterized protein LOC108734605 n=1 Tax=Agrilus planipennis TaxID=224129 RepID=A0A1W4WCN3_AGRPL|nr:uncharacterized protein LOC108734605 [Agrilus planipennis]XP_018321735.1 uncharacterized protein LOC108734605 [Agrilus planipennis]